MGRNTARHREAYYGILLIIQSDAGSLGSLIGNTRSSSPGFLLIRHIQECWANCILQCSIVLHSTGSVLHQSPNVPPIHSRLISVETVVLDWLAKALGL